MGVGENFNELKDSILTALVDTTRTVGKIAREDLAFHRSSNPANIPLLEKQSSRILRIVRTLIDVTTEGAEIFAPQIRDVDSIEDQWNGIVDISDNLLEKADACLDEYTGVIRRLRPDEEESIKNAAPSARRQRPVKNLRTQDIPKPQLQFAIVPSNDETTPFRPLLRSKPHAIVPLEQSLALVSPEDGRSHYRHPYETEIRESQYPAAVYATNEPLLYQSFADTHATLVDTPEAVASMLRELKLANEIAVDLEHHEEHSYIGLVSLMQISTRSRDWIVDTLKPWRQDLQVLNEVFANPKILKVFHGAHMDMIWLQRDLGLYVVGLFDTYHASCILGYPKHSLAYLLKRFAGFDAAKQYQMADWRLRPLPQEMFDYARSDTHFLLYIYDRMHNELVEKSNSQQIGDNFIQAVMNESKHESLRRYERPIYDEKRGLGAMGWYNLLFRTPALLNKEQFAVFRAVHQWRDTVARQHDESVQVVMPKHVLFRIATEMPINMASLLGCSHPMSSIVQKIMHELLGVIEKAKAAGIAGPEVKDLVPADPPIFSIDRPIKMNEIAQAGQTNQKIRELDHLRDDTNDSDQTAKAQVSRLWGSTVHSEVVPQMSSAWTANKALRLTLPIPQLATEVCDNQMLAASALNVDQSTQPDVLFQHQTQQKIDNIMIVKEAGGSRKRKADNPTRAYLRPSSMSRSNDRLQQCPNGEAERSPGLVPKLQDAQVGMNHKQLERQRRKADRAVEKAASGEFEAFDYANAPSVLYAKKDGNSGTAVVNPYSEATDAPKGMRKTKKESAGKSLTFRD